MDNHLWFYVLLLPLLRCARLTIVKPRENAMKILLVFMTCKNGREHIACHRKKVDFIEAFGIFKGKIHGFSGSFYAPVFMSVTKYFPFLPIVWEITIFYILLYIKDKSQNHTQNGSISIKIDNHVFRGEIRPFLYVFSTK